MDVEEDALIRRVFAVSLRQNGVETSVELPVVQLASLAQELQEDSDVASEGKQLLLNADLVDRLIVARLMDSAPDPCVRRLATHDACAGSRSNLSVVRSSAHPTLIRAYSGTRHTCALARMQTAIGPVR